jgi:hypothetical protein
MQFPLNLFAGFLSNRGDFFRDTVTIVTGSASSRVLAFLSLQDRISGMLKTLHYDI